jgi:hypothetical protein
MDRPESPAILPHFDDGKPRYFKSSNSLRLQVVMRDFGGVRTFTVCTPREIQEAFTLLAAHVNVTDPPPAVPYSASKCFAKTARALTDRLICTSSRFRGGFLSLDLSPARYLIAAFSQHVGLSDLPDFHSVERISIRSSA